MLSMYHKWVSVNDSIPTAMTLNTVDSFSSDVCHQQNWKRVHWFRFCLFVHIAIRARLALRLVFVSCAFWKKVDVVMLWPEHFYILHYRLLLRNTFTASVSSTQTENNYVNFLLPTVKPAKHCGHRQFEWHWPWFKKSIYSFKCGILWLFVNWQFVCMLCYCCRDDVFFFGCSE